MLEKDKNYIEFSMRSMTISHRPYQEDTEIDITGMIPGREILTVPNPFDIPCEVVMVPKKEFERLQRRNEELKKKIDELYDDISGRSTVIESYKRDVTRLQARVDYNAELAKQLEENYNLLLKKTGFDTVEELIFYLTNVVQCDTLQEAIASLHDKVKYTSDKYMVLEQEVKVYSKALQDWKEGTGCPSPSAAKTLIESGASWNHAYNEIKEANGKLGEEVKSWQNVTGYSKPEDYLHARINDAAPFDYTASWQKFTGCDSPQEAGCKINSLCDDICKLKGDYDHLLKLTGYKSEDDIRVALTYSEQFVYETMREFINSLKRKAKFTDSNWQAATCCETPEEAKRKIIKLENEAETWENDYNLLLALTGFDSEGEIEDFLDQHRDREKLTTVFQDLEEDLSNIRYVVECQAKELDAWTSIAGSPSPENFLSSRINNLAKGNLSWQNATGFITPEKCGEYINKLEDKLHRINGISEED